MQVRYQTAPRSDDLFFQACDRRERGRLARDVMIPRITGDCRLGAPGPAARASPGGLYPAPQALYRRTLIRSSSSSRTCLTICWLWITSVRASSPVSLLRAPPIVKP